MRRRRVVLVALASFVALGLPEAVVATAWPDMAADLHRPIGDLQWLLVSYTLGYLLSSAPAGSAITRFGVRRVAVTGVAIAITGLALYATAESWGWLIVAGYLVGTGAGPLDTAMNVWATTRGPRVMNLLHACFGIGTTLGPPLTIAAATITSWRGAYVVLIAVDLVLLIALALTGPDHHPPPVEASEPSAIDEDPPWAPTMLILGTFAVYVAVEVTAGAWGFSYLREQHQLSRTAAGFGIAAYWGALTLGRIALGVAGSGAAPRRVLSVGASASVAACMVLWLGGTAGAVVGLVALGFALAGLFPAVMLLTPELVGSARAPKVVGWSLSASGISMGLAAVIVGQQVDRSGLDVIGANLVVGSIVLWLLVTALIRQRTPAQASRSARPGSASSTDSSPNSSTRRSSGR